jgi:tripartite-type tricarboxylate transporter receptor subunit TctC
MTSFKFLGAMLVLSALLATPASAWQSASEPAAAASEDPTFSIYSNNGRGFSGTMAAQPPLGDASGLPMSARPHRGNHTSGVKRY